MKLVSEPLANEKAMTPLNIMMMEMIFSMEVLAEMSP
jgi:hypothetical protein